MTEPLLEAHGLVAGYNRRPVVGPFDFAVRGGETLAFVGPNGVGKSTILKTIAGVLSPLAGTLTYRGRSIAGSAAYVNARDGLVLVGEHRANVLRTLTVEENLALTAGTKRSGGSFDPFAAFPRLHERRRQQAATLSGGELQILALAMAMSLSPSCLLLDEPSAGLAPIMISDVRDTLAGMRTNMLSMIVAEQRPDVVRGLCDRVAVVARGTIADLGSDPDLSSDALGAAYFTDAGGKER